MLEAAEVKVKLIIPTLAEAAVQEAVVLAEVDLAEVDLVEADLVDLVDLVAAAAWAAVLD